MIGSCTNGNYKDIARAALVFKGHHVHEDVSCTCAISTKQIYKQLLHDGYIDVSLDEQGCAFLELACGPCTSIGQSPATEAISVRTTNRNFRGRGGNPNASVYLVSPESAAATAIAGVLTTAEEIMGQEVSVLGTVEAPERYP